MGKNKNPARKSRKEFLERNSDIASCLCIWRDESNGFLFTIDRCDDDEMRSSIRVEIRTNRSDDNRPRIKLPTDLPEESIVIVVDIPASKDIIGLCDCFDKTIIEPTLRFCEYISRSFCPVRLDVIDIGIVLTCKRNKLTKWHDSARERSDRHAYAGDAARTTTPVFRFGIIKLKEEMFFVL